MADIRESFPVLEDASGEGVALREIQDGDSSAGKAGLLGFSFKDASGNAVLPQLNANGTIAVSNGAAATVLHARGENAGSLVNVDVATISLTASKQYEEIRANGSCFRETIFQVVQVDDATETILDEFLVGSGQYSYSIDLGEYQVTAGATGTQSLIVRAKNLQKASTMRARIIASELI